MQKNPLKNNLLESVDKLLSYNNAFPNLTINTPINILS